MSQPEGRPANGLVDYAEAIANFSLDGLAAKLHGSLETGLNACVECCDRHVSSGGVALEWESQDGRRETYTFAQLQELSARFGGLLASHGVKPAMPWQACSRARPRCLSPFSEPGGQVLCISRCSRRSARRPSSTASRSAKPSFWLRTTANRAKLDEIANCPAVAVVRRSGADSVRAGDLDSAPSWPVSPRASSPCRAPATTRSC